MPRLKDMAHVVITVRGGVVALERSAPGVNVEIRDYDCKGKGKTGRDSVGLACSRQRFNDGTTGESPQEEAA